MNFVVADTAKLDVHEIEQFLGSPSRASAEFAASFSAAVRHLLRWPDTGVTRPDLTRRRVLFWFATPYFIVYERHPEQIVIVRVLHSARNIRKALRLPKENGFSD